MKYNEQFWAMPKRVFEMHNISLEARNIYMVLFTRMNGENTAWPSQKYMAEKIGRSVRSIRNYLDELVEAGLMNVDRQGLTRTNRYNLREANSADQEEQPVAHQDGKPVADHSKRTIKRTDIATPAADFNFQEYLNLMERDQRTIQIIALYWKHTGKTYENRKQAGAAVKRDLRAAAELSGYSNDQITDTMSYLDGVDYLDRWTLETVNKYIDSKVAVKDWRVIEK